MIEGHVRFTEHGSEPVIRVRVFGENTSEMEIVAVIDTGFTGDLTLPSDIVEVLSLVPTGSRDATLADDHNVDLWHERRIQRIEALGGTPLVGMELPRGNELCIQATPGGRVVVARFRAARFHGVLLLVSRSVAGRSGVYPYGLTLSQLSRILASLSCRGVEYLTVS